MSAVLELGDSARALAWIETFREMADRMEREEPPPGIDPILWAAQRDAARAMQVDLEQQMAAAHDALARELDPALESGKVLWQL